MNTTAAQVHRVERVDDIPVLLATLRRMNVADVLDRHFPSGHRWQGALTFGEVACVWLAFITSQGDHRLCAVQPWAQDNLHTLSACLGKAVRPLDFQDDRLADMLDHLAQDDSWLDCEADLNRHTVRVYHLDPRLFRVDTTTANSYVETLSELGLFQFGHSKDRDDQPQIKVALATLDPLGLPVTTFVVPGNCADDPLYLPEIHKVQQAFGQGGKTFVGDCKAAALATRAYLASTRDYYLCPLSEKHVSAEQRRALLQPVWEGRQRLQQVYRPAAAGEELVAEGFSLDVPVQAEVAGRPLIWTERRWLVRSLAFAAGQHQQLERRLHQAQEQLVQLNERRQGKKRLSAAEMAAAAEAIVKKQRVEGMLGWEVRTRRQTKEVRGYGGRPRRVVREQEHRLEVWRQEEVIAAAKREMGWRVYATNELRLNLAGVVWGYRGQNRLEDNWSRLKGQPLGLTPMYLQYESRIQGLVLLLSLALRLLTLLEWTVRRKLQESAQTLCGLYAGQPGRQAKRPSAELLLGAFKGINLAIVEAGRQRAAHLTPLTTLQERLLALWELPADLYHRLTLHIPADLYHRLTLHIPEPPPI
jgi:transposase